MSIVAVTVNRVCPSCLQSCFQSCLWFEAALKAGHWVKLNLFSAVAGFLNMCIAYKGQLILLTVNSMYKAHVEGEAATKNAVVAALCVLHEAGKLIFAPTHLKSGAAYADSMTAVSACAGSSNSNIPAPNPTADGAICFALPKDPTPSEQTAFNNFASALLSPIDVWIKVRMQNSNVTWTAEADACLLGLAKELIEDGTCKNTTVSIAQWVCDSGNQEETESCGNCGPRSTRKAPSPYG